MHLPASLAACLLLIAGGSQKPFPEGVVVEKVLAGSAAGIAGFQPDDRILNWHRAPNGVSDGGAPEQAVGALDLWEVDYEHLPRGPVTFRLSRAGQPLTIMTVWDSVGLWTTTRPAFPAGLLDLYERGRALAREGKLEKAATLWREVADGARTMDGGLPAACWMLGRIGSEWAPKDVEASAGAYGEAVACAEKLGPAAVAALLVEQGGAATPPGGYSQRMEAYRRALQVRREAGMGRAADGVILLFLGQTAMLAGNRDEGIRSYRQSVATFEAVAPASPNLALSLAWLSVSVQVDGDLEGAEALLTRAAQIAEKAAPEGWAMATVLSAQDIMARQRGDLATAERLARRLLAVNLKIAPRTATTCQAQLQLGTLVHSRGDLDGAAAWYRGGLELADTIKEADTRSIRGMLLHQLGLVASERGDLATAESHMRQGLELFEAVSPEGNHVVQMLIPLGRVLDERGGHTAARSFMDRALAMSRKLFPAGSLTAEALTGVGDLQRRGGELEAAEASYESARAILERAPAGSSLARVLHGLGRIQWARGQPKRAASLFARAVEVLEAQRGRVGTTQEARSLFSSNFYGIYHDQVEVLVGLGRTAEALHVSERARARGLLTLMSERDLVLEDAPPELERQRRQVDAEYHQARMELNRLGADAEAQIARLSATLRGLGEKQAEIMDRIRQASPRLANYHDPQPLDATRIRAALDPGAALLAYSVGSSKTVVFVLTPGEPGEQEVRAAVIPQGSDELRPRIAAWRRMAERSAPPPEFFAEARALYDVLVRPLERHLASARRLIISADGPLHQLPFAALRRDGAYLAEWKPLTLVPSGTLLAQLSQSRPASRGAPSLVAFGDPRPPGLPVLEGGRREVLAISTLFHGSRAYLGAAATEEQVKVLGRGARYVHFAVHGLVDERSPLESALAFSPNPSEAGGDGGLLQAWEIFERVRLDAELVTLSACRSAAGTEVAGEGVLGLTRAFQYAGARSVLASLWRVPDRSTPAFMRWFYEALKRGLAKDEALRRAQLASIRAGHHPIRWASFQLYGDWR